MEAEGQMRLLKKQTWICLVTVKEEVAKNPITVLKDTISGQSVRVVGAIDLLERAALVTMVSI